MRCMKVILSKVCYLVDNFRSLLTETGYEILVENFWSESRFQMQYSAHIVVVDYKYRREQRLDVILTGICRIRYCHYFREEFTANVIDIAF